MPFDWLRRKRATAAAERTPTTRQADRPGYFSEPSVDRRWFFADWWLRALTELGATDDIAASRGARAALHALDAGRDEAAMEKAARDAIRGRFQPPLLSGGDGELIIFARHYANARRAGSDRETAQGLATAEHARLKAETRAKLDAYLATRQPASAAKPGAAAPMRDPSLTQTHLPARAAPMEPAARSVPVAASQRPTDMTEDDAEWEEMTRAIAPFDKANLAVRDEDIERQIRTALDGIAAKAERGIAFLLEKLYEDLRFDGTTLHHPAWGDDAWNIWLKKRELVRAIARSGMRGATLHLERFLDADSNDAQFHSILRPALAEALKQLEPGAVGAPAPAPKPKEPRCAVCDRDLSGAPAMRDNLTGAYYCYDHRDRIGR